MTDDAFDAPVSSGGENTWLNLHDNEPPAVSECVVS